MSKLFGASWRSAVTGYAVAIGNVIIPLMQGGHPTLKQIAASAGIAAFGYFVKDKQVTGGTTLNTNNNPAVVVTSAVVKEP
jgi:hypothetical protein